jgi:hypothetical protein
MKNIKIMNRDYPLAPTPKTKDSTDYFNRAEKSFMTLANSEFKKGNESVSNKMVKLAKNSFENKQRQKLKGALGYDKNGYPIKK